MRQHRGHRTTPRRLGVEGLEPRLTPAAIGSLDPSFGAGGVVAADFGGAAAGAAVARQADGKVVAVGSAGGDFAVARFNPDGSPDATFNGTGFRAIDFVGGADVGTAVVVQSDGKIVVAGTAGVTGGTDFAVARLNPDGSLDTTFAGGRLTVNLAGTDAAAGVAAQSDGKVVVVGSTSAVGGGAFAVIRVNANGTLDTSYGGAGTGLVTVDFGAGADAAAGVALYPGDRVVVVGTAAAGTTPGDIAVARLTTTGTLDGSFNTTGKQTLDFGGNEAGAAVAVQPDGRVVVVGTTGVGTATADVVVARYTAGGALDTTFNSAGTADVSFGGRDVAAGVAVDPDGRVVVAATSDAGGAADFAVLRLYGNGNFDASFGPSGQRAFDRGGAEAAGGVAVDPQGRVILVGTSGSPGDLTVLRVTGTPQLGRNLGVSGNPNGTAVVYAPVANGSVYDTTPVAAPGPFGSAAVAVRTAVGDVNGDGVQDTVLVTGPGAAIRVAVVSGVDNTTLLVSPFDPFGGDFTGGGFVAAGDIDNDGRAEFVVTPDQGGGPRVTIFSLLPAGLALRANFFGIDDPAFRGGCRAAVGDVNRDGVADLAVAAGFLGGPRVAVFDGRTLSAATPGRLLNDFFAFPGADAVTLRNGAFVAAGDVDGDGFADLVFGGGPGGAPRVFVLSGRLLAAGNVPGAYAAPVANFFFAGLTDDRGGIRVAAKDVDLDGLADVAVGGGENVSSRARVYFGKTVVGATGEPAGFQDLDPYGNAFIAGGVFVG